MKICFGKIYDDHLSECEICKELNRCYLISKAREERKLFRDIKNHRDEESFLESLRRKGYYV